MPVRHVMQTVDDLQEKADEQFNQDIIEVVNDPDTDGWRLREIITAVVVCTLHWNLFILTHDTTTKFVIMTIWLSRNLRFNKR